MKLYNYIENIICPTTEYDCCQRGNLRRLKYLMSINNTIEVDQSYFYIAAFNGNLNIIKYLVSINVSIYGDKILAQGNNIMKHLISKHTMSAAAQGKNSLNIIKYLVSVNVPITPNVIAFVSEKGDLETVKYLISINAPIDSHAVFLAAHSGHLNLVKYLISIDAPMDKTALFQANHFGYLNIVKCLLIANAPYHQSNKLDILKKELLLEIKLSMSEYIGPDIAIIILQNLFQARST